MERLFKCFGCGNKFVMDIPEEEIKPLNISTMRQIDLDYDRPSIDVRNMRCPKCNKLGMLQAEYKKIDEKIIKISEKENFILSPFYPWSFKPSRIEFKTCYQYYMAHFLNVGDYKKVSEIESREEIDKFIKDYPKWKKKVFDREYYLNIYLRNRGMKDEEFRDELMKYDGYKIELVDKDNYLGVKYTKNGKSGKNIYGKLLMKLVDKIYEEIEIIHRR